MTDKLIFPNQPIIPVNQSQANIKARLPNSQSVSFDQVFQDALQKSSVKFSQHAQARLKARDIQLSNVELQKIDNAVTKAAAKGAKESLILMKDLAFVVSIKNKTVITAVDGASLKDNIFTNIDSAIIL